MFRSSPIRWSRIVLICLGIWLTYTWVSAQEGVYIRVSDPDTNQFPLISLSLSITDDRGRHVSGLSAPDFMLIEDGETIAIDSLEETSIGTRQIFIINSTRGLRGRDIYGFTRYDYVRRALVAWWSRSDAAIIGVDDLNLIALQDSLVSHSSTAAQLASAITAYEPELEEEFASFDILVSALDVLADPLPRPGMPTLVFFITPFIEDAQDLPLADTITQAEESGTTIYPILVGPEEILDYPQVQNLRLLAETTGGELIMFDPDVGLNDLAERVLTRRLHYEMDYTSHINREGYHNIQIHISTDGLDVISEPSSFTLTVSPPEVLFVQPPDHITRQTDDPSLPLESIPPLSTSLEVLVTFPDGYPRDIISSQLIVDGEVVTTHQSPPFDTFEWDLQEYRETGVHNVQVLVEDSLGLQASTLELSIDVSILTPPKGLAALQPTLGVVLGIVGVLVFGVVLSIAIVAYSRRRRLRPSPAAQVSRRSREQRQLIGSRRRIKAVMAEANLVPVSNHGLPISLVGTDLILGRDASISATRIDDPSVSAMHVRLIRLASGDYLVRDQGSIAGTWVNYEPIPESGKVLKHGDMIHLGRVAYRFLLRNPPPEPEISIRSFDSFASSQST
jgi:hypothetical protein